MHLWGLLMTRYGFVAAEARQYPLRVIDQVDERRLTLKVGGASAIP